MSSMHPTLVVQRSRTVRLMPSVFYNVIPGPKDAQGRRLYIHDKALKNDPFAELAILLFPSPAGTAHRYDQSTVKALVRS
jgi:hypothetical protein